MPLVIPGLTVSIFVLLGVVTLIGLRRTTAHWVGALLDGFSDQSGFRKWFFRAIGLTAVVHATTWVINRVAHSLGVAANANLAPVATYLTGVAHALHYLVDEYGKIAETWAGAFAHFRGRTLPRTIDHRIAPTATAAAHAGALAGRSISLGQREAKERRRSIDRIATRVGALAAGFLGIDALVKGRSARHHHADHTRVLPRAAHDAARAREQAQQAQREASRASSRVKRIEKLVTGLLGGLIVYRVLARVAPWLFCRNWKVLGRAVCGLNPKTLQSLLGLLAAVIVLRDLLSLARHGESIVGYFGGTIQTALGVERKPPGRFTID